MTLEAAQADKRSLVVVTTQIGDGAGYFDIDVLVLPRITWTNSDFWCCFVSADEKISNQLVSRATLGAVPSVTAHPQRSDDAALGNFEDLFSNRDTPSSFVTHRCLPPSE